jgi:hypothetical protein
MHAARGDDPCRAFLACIVATKSKQIMLAAGVRRPAPGIFPGTARAGERALTEMLFGSNARQSFGGGGGCIGPMIFKVH